MSEFIKILCLTCVLSVMGLAQTQTDDYRKNEFYGGFSHQQVEGAGHRPANGFEVAYVRNIHRYFGLKADFSGAYRRDNFQLSGSDPTNGAFSYRGRVNGQLYNILGGVQVKNNASKARFKPFGHALAGAAVSNNRFSALTCTSGDCPSYVTDSVPGTFRRTHFAMAVGGGLDIKLSDRIDFRAVQVDYNPIFRSGADHNFRFGVGFVFK